MKKQCDRKKRSIKKTVTSLFLLLILFSLFSCSLPRDDHQRDQTKSDNQEFDSQKIERQIHQRISQMSPEEKIGQMIVAGFQGTELSDGQIQYIQSHHIGNVIIFGQNTRDREQIAALNTQLQKAILEDTGIPALIGIDQEGGKVMRIESGVTCYPGNMAVAATGHPDYAEKIGAGMGQELRSLGIYADFAPVLDVNSNPDNPVINTRSYSDDPETVAKYGCQMIEGLKSQGILACGKHFPGHGDTNTDSHYGLPIINKSMDNMEKNELLPFRAAIADGVDMLMVSHIVFPAYDPQKLPASMSPSILTGLLRRQLGFQGLIITDSMTMGAIKDHYGVAQGSLAAAKAGADLILTGDGSSRIPDDPDPQGETIALLVAAAKDGSLPMSRIDDGVERILTYKMKLGLFDQCYPDPDVTNADWSTHGAFAQKVADESVTLIQDRLQLLPFISAASSAEKPVAVDLNHTYSNTLFLSPRTGGNASLSLAEEAGVKLGASFYSVSPNPTVEEINQAAALAKQADLTVIAVTDTAHKKGQAALVKRIMALQPHVVLIFMGSPYDSAAFPNAGASLCTYEYSKPAITAVLKVFAGEIPPQGICPVKLPGVLGA